ncbi:MAG TPA: phosphoribosylformylglycinamidine synthase subunit PurQ, partial [Bacteroidia bacterium]|nr:phosphoribosylformylglycinamidine synthase subunit PurQ [Bacteroidia bacterium]
AYFKNAFNTLQNLIKERKITAGHDVGSGGLITSLLELCFSNVNVGAEIDLTALNEKDSVKALFNENISIVIQGDSAVESVFAQNSIQLFKIGKVVEGNNLTIKNSSDSFTFNISETRDTWYKTSFLLDSKQSRNGMAKERYSNYKNQPLQFEFPSNFNGTLENISTRLDMTKRPKAAIIREKGSNSEREMANAMYLAGFDVKDVHMTDLISGRETLEDIQFIGAVGGFSNSDVLGSAKGWAGAF